LWERENMKHWIIRWIANILALLIIVKVVPGITLDPNHPVMLFVAVIALGLANAIIRPIIMFFVWPINCLTFGLFGFVVNALLFFAVGRMNLGFIIKPGVDGFIASLIGSVGMGVISGLINFVLKDGREKGGNDKKDREK
jgi:putative membrane protein